MKKFNSLLNGGVAHLKSFTRLKPKQLSQSIIPILEEYKYDAAILYVGIKDLLIFDKNSTTHVSIWVTIWIRALIYIASMIKYYYMVISILKFQRFV